MTVMKIVSVVTYVTLFLLIIAYFRHKIDMSRRPSEMVIENQPQPQYTEYEQVEVKEMVKVIPPQPQPRKSQCNQERSLW